MKNKKIIHSFHWTKVLFAILTLFNTVISSNLSSMLLRSKTEYFFWEKNELTWICYIFITIILFSFFFSLIEFVLWYFLWKTHQEEDKEQDKKGTVAKRKKWHKKSNKNSLK